MYVSISNWTLTDDKIIVNKKEIPLSSIIDANHRTPKPNDKYGAITIFLGSGMYDFEILYYPLRQQNQREEGEKAAEYILDFVSVEKERKVIEEKDRKKQPNFLFITFITFAITLFIAWLIGVTFFGWNDNANKSSKTNYETCAMCGDRVPEDDMRGKWCKDCQNDAFGEDGGYDKIKD